MAVQPHLRRRTTPRQLLPLPWDTRPSRENAARPEPAPLTAAQRLERFEKLIKQ